MSLDSDLVWYVAYGSNLASARLRLYLSGGRPLGGLRTYAGARDSTSPRRSRSVELPGHVLFAGESSVWTGGIAFYFSDSTGKVSARAYLLTSEQVTDLVAQEIRKPPGTELVLLAPEPNSTRAIAGGAYDIALRLEDIDGHPALTISTSRSLDPTSPSAAYLSWICRGLHETYGWPPPRIAMYLGQFSGVRGTWTQDELTVLAAGSLTEPAASPAEPR